MPSTVHPNAYCIGERVEWHAREAENHSAGAGVIDGIYLSMVDRLVYRVARDEIDRDRHRPFEFLHEADLRREVVG